MSTGKRSRNIVIYAGMVYCYLLSLTAFSAQFLLWFLIATFVLFFVFTRTEARIVPKGRRKINFFIQSKRLWVDLPSIKPFSVKNMTFIPGFLPPCGSKLVLHKFFNWPGCRLTTVQFFLRLQILSLAQPETQIKDFKEKKAKSCGFCGYVNNQ